MLPRDTSPIHRIVSRLRQAPRVTPGEISHTRAELYAAAASEITENLNLGIVYDPHTDQRFRWACQWIEVAERTRSAVDPDTEFMCSLLINQPMESGKLFAAEHEPDLPS